MRTHSHARRRRGLTLTELIVVLAILVGLAGVIIPLLPSMHAGDGEVDPDV